MLSLAKGNNYWNGWILGHRGNYALKGLELCLNVLVKVPRV